MTDFAPDETLPKQPIPAYVETLARAGLNSLATYLVTINLIKGDQQDAVISAGMYLIPILWGLVAAYLNRKKLNAAIVAPSGQATP